jgi:hypothetical protein
MIKKKCSYAFIEFVRGYYNITRRHDLVYLFDNMTITEKLIINSFNFSLIWYHSYNRISTKYESSIYNKGENKFNQLKLIRNGILLNELINNSTNIDLLWEIPKGRLNKNETELCSAIREFEEETNIHKSKYRLLLNEKSVEYIFIDNGVRYKYVYFLAIANSKINIKYNFNCKYMSIEVGDIKFLTSEYIKSFNNNRLFRITQIIIKKCKKYIL